VTRAFDRIVVAAAASGAVLSGLAFLVGGVDVGIGALAGSAVATANWAAIRYLVGRALDRKASKSSLILLLITKMTALFAVSYLVVVVGGVSALGFGVGVSALVLGLVIGGRGFAESQEEQG
jgi:hypothetical protein